jgi:hypothetical protein
MPSLEDGEIDPPPPFISSVVAPWRLAPGWEREMAQRATSFHRVAFVSVEYGDCYACSRPLSDRELIYE